MRTTGTVKWFNDAKGFGFITPANGQKAAASSRSPRASRWNSTSCRDRRDLRPRTSPASGANYFHGRTRQP